MKKKKEERGQASIVIGMFILTFMLFFAFVVNTGMLINAKINLQNAADLAAYSGAAAQARQLTLLSFVNYEMRRQYKKFLFRYYILGTMFQDSFPGKKGGVAVGTGPRSYYPGPDAVNSGTAAPYPVPAVCVDLYSAPSGTSANSFGGQEAYCRIRTLPKIQGASGAGAVSGGSDAIQTTLDQELNAIEQVREAACDNLSAINQTLLFFWLFNTLPEGPTIADVAGTNGTNANGTAAFNSTSLQIMYDRVKYLASGLGLVPRELLLSFRAGVLQSWVNQPAALAMDRHAVDTWRSSAEAMKHERSINAFKSAYDTLGDSTWDASTIRIDELLPNPSGTPLLNPPGNPQVNLLELTPINISFTAYSVGYEGNPPNSPTAKDCIQKLYGIPVWNLPVSFYKTQNFTTYYAVRLSADARVLFSPWGPKLNLTAYSAAMPFGSRIGPNESVYGKDPSTFFTYPINTTFNVAEYIPQNVATALGNMPSFAPNLPVQKGDADASFSAGWNRDDVQAAFYQSVPQFGNRQEYDALLNVAMVPNPWEEGLFDIPNDLVGNGADPFVQWFDKNAEAAFWIPIVDGPPGQFVDALKDAITNYFTSGVGSVTTGSVAGNSSYKTPAQLQSVITNSMVQYASERLISHQGPTEGLNQADTPPPGAVSEGVYIMPMADPFRVPPGIYTTVDGTNSAVNVSKGSLSPPIPISTSSGVQGILAPPTTPGTPSGAFFVDPQIGKEVSSVRDSWNGVQDSKFVPAGRVGYSVEFVPFDTIRGFSNAPSTSDAEYEQVLSAIKH